LPPAAAAGKLPHVITFIEGVVEHKAPAEVVLNAGGVGYELAIPLSTFERLPREGETCRLWTHHLVREDDEALYGFATTEERGLFRHLLAVNGVGPRTALSALSGLARRELVRAVSEGDVKRLSSIPGIGRKTAERIITELRDRFDAAEVLAAAAGAGGATGPADQKTRDVLAALMALGYRQAEAIRILEAVPAAERSAMSVEELIRRALRPPEAKRKDTP
jgi:holliday junction DNA helicase RuvA